VFLTNSKKESNEVGLYTERHRVASGVMMDNKSGKDENGIDSESTWIGLRI
jgi:hypothetical protein